MGHSDRYGVIILNWNGSNDTIECIESVLKFNSNAFIIIVDNNSSDNSVENISNLDGTSDISLIIADKEEQLLSKEDIVENYNILLFESNENLGFAKGCNLGLHLSMLLSLKTIIMLNNDTVVREDALNRLVNFLDINSDVFAVIPKINYYKSSIIWNCGGRISILGFRKYFYPNFDEKEIKIPKEIVCSFFTGCCFAVRTDEFSARGGFTERFFFGEEDFELSLWLKDRKKKAICLTDCTVDHKVSSSTKRLSNYNNSSKVFIHYLNRFIHMRIRFGKLLWIIWLVAYIPYLSVLLTRKKIIPFSAINKFFVELLRMSSKKNEVTRNDFESIMKSK